MDGNMPAGRDRAATYPHPARRLPTTYPPGGRLPSSRAPICFLLRPSVWNTMRKSSVPVNLHAERALMASHSLYRKWRSQTFSDLVGQEPVVRTLLNAVREGRLAHAYLFCGPRGTGKTSAARLLAKAVNCANPRDGEPRNECLSCREIMAGHSPDVIDVDAASDTRVANIRELRQNANLVGSGGRYKLYIVDECFSYGELVTLADGSKMPIGKLVETQWQGEVLSYNERTGEIEPKPIVRHMRKQASAPTVRVT